MVNILRGAQLKTSKNLSELAKIGIAVRAHKAKTRGLLHPYIVQVIHDENKMLKARKHCSSNKEIHEGIGYAIGQLMS